ncbi:MAG: Rne/Rng family ribonuclease, partial [Deltaproteobacteria bacterium]|nr:Rne/Rng family ribonuclease [Deltaproteobacteria bacterium]
MSTELIINATLPETRIALLENHEISELHIERDSERGIVGNIYKGRVIRVLPGMQACFVDIGLEKAAFLYVDDIFFPDMKSPLATNPLPEPGLQAPRAPGAPEATRGGGRGRGRMGRGQAPVPPTPNAPAGSPEAHAAAQADYAQQMLESGGELPEGEAPLAPENAPPVAAETHPADAALPEGQPEARSPQGETFDDEDEDEGGEPAYRPEPLIDAAAWAEDLSADDDEEDDAEAAALTEGAPAETASGAPSPEASESGQAQESPASEAQPADAPVTAASQPPVAPLAEALTERPQGKAPVEPRPSPVKPVGVAEDEDESEMPRRRRRREPVNIADIIKEGQEIVVQVAKDPIGTKGARLTCHVSLPGRYLVFMPTVDHIGVSRRIESEGERRRLKETMSKIRPSKTGVIVRTASGKQTDRQLKQDLDYLVTTWNDIQKKFLKQRSPSVVYQDLTIVLRAIRDMFTDEVDKVIVDSKREHRAIMKFVTRFIPQVRDKVELYEGAMPLFDAYGIETEISRALERKVWLKSGGYLVVDQTEALVSIDVNTGRYVGKKTLEETILKTNLEAVREIAYQLRLRNCGGIIILDLIDMEKEANKEKVYKALEEALKKDRSRPSILKISSLGLIEMTRKRTRDSMVRSLCEPCSYCEGKGFVKNKLTIAYDIMRDIERELADKDNIGISIQCHPTVADVLLEDKRDVLEDMEQSSQKRITVRGNGAYHVEQYELVAQRPNKNMVWSS